MCDDCRWSRIARKLPGRTDNEIKNYWRTHMRKKRAQEKKHATPSISSSPDQSSSCQSSHFSNSNHGVDSHASNKESEEENYQVQEIEQGYSMDDIWKDIAMSEDDINVLQPDFDGTSEENSNNLSCPIMPSTSSWDYSYLDPLWVMDEEESKMLFPPIGDQYFSFYDQQREHISNWLIKIVLFFSSSIFCSYVYHLS
uniref:Uncharacterized protein n=1 Tax=Medicago truncatula TaxID=3880 RepID=I3SFP1_MEDTR|nr:unknown [Medicago truncatula]